jgi:hypothetical protein
LASYPEKLHNGHLASADRQLLVAAPPTEGTGQVAVLENKVLASTPAAAHVARPHLVTVRIFHLCLLGLLILCLGFFFLFLFVFAGRAFLGAGDPRLGNRIAHVLRKEGAIDALRQVQGELEEKGRSIRIRIRLTDGSVVGLEDPRASLASRPGRAAR